MRLPTLPPPTASRDLVQQGKDTKMRIPPPLAAKTPAFLVSPALTVLVLDHLLKLVQARQVLGARRMGLAVDEAAEVENAETRELLVGKCRQGGWGALLAQTPSTGAVGTVVQLTAAHRRPASGRPPSCVSEVKDRVFSADPVKGRQSPAAPPPHSATGPTIVTNPNTSAPLAVCSTPGRYVVHKTSES